MKNKQTTNPEQAAIFDATREKPIENADLLDEIGLILPDYFMTKSMSRSAQSLQIKFYNGDIKRITLESVVHSPRT